MALAQILLLVGFLNGFVLIAALLARKDNRLPNFFLAGAIAAGLYFQFILFLRATGRIGDYPLLRRSGFPAGLLAPTLLYLYTQALTTPNFRLRPRLLFYFLPVGFALLWYLAFFLLPTDIAWNSDPVSMRHESYFRAIIGSIVCGIYLYGCFMQLKRYRSFIRIYFSDLRRIRLAWLQWLLLLFVPSWITSVAEVATGPHVTLEKYSMLAITLATLLMGLFGLKQSAVFAGDSSWDLAPGSPPKAPPPRPPLFSEAEISQWKKRLDDAMDQEKFYLNSELRLFDLGKSLGLKSYQVSELINRATGSNFYDYVNRRRVEEAKRRLLDPAYAHMNILGIATDCGFHSKSVFNDLFRKIVGQTPSVFRNQKRV